MADASKILLTLEDLAGTKSIRIFQKQISYPEAQINIGENMNKLELISALRQKMDLSKPEAAGVVDIFFNNMAETLASGDRVDIRGLCSFCLKGYEGYVGRNPKTGELFPIKPKKLPLFKAGRELKKRVEPICVKNITFMVNR
jgi:integration host factor subunit beta